jgi:uncharacterized Zn-finger protein
VVIGRRSAGDANVYEPATTSHFIEQRFPGLLMTPFETIEIDGMVAACAGANRGDGALGHPKVYLNLAPSGRVECPYCSRLFVNRALEARPGEVAQGAAHG